MCNFSRFVGKNIYDSRYSTRSKIVLDEKEKIKLLRNTINISTKCHIPRCLLHLKGTEQYTEFPAQRARRIGR